MQTTLASRISAFVVPSRALSRNRCQTFNALSRIIDVRQYGRMRNLHTNTQSHTPCTNLLQLCTRRMSAPVSLSPISHSHTTKRCTRPSPARVLYTYHHAAAMPIKYLNCFVGKAGALRRIAPAHSASFRLCVFAPQCVFERDFSIFPFCVFNLGTTPQRHTAQFLWATTNRQPRDSQPPIPPPHPNLCTNTHRLIQCGTTTITTSTQHQQQHQQHHRRRYMYTQIVFFYGKHAR